METDNRDRQKKMEWLETMREQLISAAKTVPHIENYLIAPYLAYFNMLFATLSYYTIDETLYGYKSKRPSLTEFVKDSVTISVGFAFRSGFRSHKEGTLEMIAPSQAKIVQSVIDLAKLPESQLSFDRIETLNVIVQVILDLAIVENAIATNDNAVREVILVAKALKDNLTEDDTTPFLQSIMNYLNNSNKIALLAIPHLANHMQLSSELPAVNTLTTQFIEKIFASAYPHREFIHQVVAVKGQGAITANLDIQGSDLRPR